MTIEDKAKTYAAENRRVAIGVDEVFDISSQIERAYLAGATEALAEQWRSVEDELPEGNTMVLCRMKSNGAIVSGYITKQYSDYPMVATDPSFHFEDWGENEFECTHWMRLPEPPEDERRPRSACDHRHTDRIDTK